jgi:CHAT domain-containing protein
MSQFYNNLAMGNDKHQSLLNAQSYLRNYEGGCYSDPQYWAAFILLDAIH